MGDIHYMISEAAKVVGVESHVLRYWEEELGLTIGRTETGYRYYTEEDIQLFHCIRKLKDEGVLLKELKLLIPDIQKAKNFRRSNHEEEIKIHPVHINKVSEKDPTDSNPIDRNPIDSNLTDSNPTDSNPIDMVRILQSELTKNNKLLVGSICTIVTDSMKTEVSYLLDAKEQLEEDRYRRLDTLIRQQQIHRKEQSRRRIPAVMRNALGFN